MSDFEKTINASDLIDWIIETCPDWCEGTVRSIIDHVEAMPSAQSEPNYDEWCTDCKEYDQERHCCPRWNRVIRETLKDAQTETIRCKDCRWWKDQTGATAWLPCRAIVTPSDFYCARAERREE